MARLYTGGAEIDAGTGVTQNTGPDGTKVNTVTRDTSVFRSGLASWKCDSAAGNLASRVNTGVVTIADGNTYFLRAYVLLAAAPGTASGILGIPASSTNVYVRLRTDGAVELLTGGVVRGSPSAASIVDSTWHRVELKATATATNTWTAAELLLDGVSVATWTGSVARTLTNAVAFGWGAGDNVAPGANKIINIDDVGFNDSTGASNNTYPGDGKVVLLSPTSDNARGTGWTTDSAGTTGFFDALNNTPPVGIADTTASTGLHQIRNATSNANSNVDLDMTTYTAAGVGAADTINAVAQVVATAAPVTTSAKQGTFALVSNPAVASASLSATGTSGAFWAGATAGTFGAGWKWSFGAIQDVPSVTLGTAPVARVTQVTSSTRIAMVCFVGMYVDYTPASARVPRNPGIDSGYAVMCKALRAVRRWRHGAHGILVPEVSFVH